MRETLLAILMVMLILCAGCQSQEVPVPDDALNIKYDFQSSIEVKAPTGETVRVECRDGYQVCDRTDFIIVGKNDEPVGIDLMIVDEEGRQNELKECQEVYGHDAEVNEDGSFIYDMDSTTLKAYPIKGTDSFVVANYPHGDDTIEHITFTEVDK